MPWPFRSALIERNSDSAFPAIPAVGQLTAAGGGAGFEATGAATGAAGGAAAGIAVGLGRCVGLGGAVVGGGTVGVGAGVRLAARRESPTDMAPGWTRASSSATSRRLCGACWGSSPAPTGSKLADAACGEERLEDPTRRNAEAMTSNERPPARSTMLIRTLRRRVGEFPSISVDIQAPGAHRVGNSPKGASRCFIGVSTRGLEVGRSQPAG